MSTDKQKNANRKNAQHSTGPNTEEGKEISSFNRFKHGLCGRFMMVAGESPQDFNRLVTWLHEENKPETTEETILISKMAEHFWLNQRAQTLQTETLNAAAESEGTYGTLTKEERHQQFIVYMRYASNHERDFHKCQDKLTNLRAQRDKRQIGFEWLAIEKAKEKRRQELHELKLAAAKTAKKKAERSESEKSTPKTAPAGTNISCEQLGKLFTSTMRTSEDEKTPDPVVPDKPKAA